MSSNPTKSNTENSKHSKECASTLHLWTKNFFVQRFLEPFLAFLVCLHSDYLEESYVGHGDEKETCKKFEDVNTEGIGKIFSVNSPAPPEETKFFKEVIELVNSKCKDVLESQNDTCEKAKYNEDKNFYKKLFCLLNGSKLDCPVRKKEFESDGNFTTISNFSGFTCGEEERIHNLAAIVKEKEAILKELEETHQQAVAEYEKEGVQFRETITTLQNSLKETEEILDDITTEYGRLKTDIEKEKKKAILKKELNHNVSSTSASTSEHQISKEESSFRAEQSLTNVPTNDIERQLHNNYKQLLLYISENLLRDNKVELGNWAESNFSVKTSPCAYQILVELDKSGVISSSNLAVLRDFFEGITRIDLVLIIENFLAGDYSLLRSIQSTRNGNHGHLTNTYLRSNDGQRSNDIHFYDPVAREQSLDPRTSVEVLANQSKGGLKYNVPHEQSLAVMEETTRGPTVVENAQRSSASSNGSKLSKPQRKQETQQDHRDNQQYYDNVSDYTNVGPWLCDHYKRRCLVKFDCCGTYWPCHRCHNNRSNCGRRKLKSRDTRSIKCVHCQREQPFNESSQFCAGCGTKFAEYFCAICRHLTGTDDSPYHCHKCGICRIHGDRSFHCDVCGVCLDVQLKDNHKCREGSAHDECCICLEDAFTGCQILPCSHKVHKECATQMIRSGITRCPICRESFAHKLERRSTSKHNRNNQGKK